ncbi:MAG TPA: hypothetical protein VHH15_04815 [Actinophytocola sp.]|nr:hypothetical protein [Actinophytocola sp.]
MKPAQPRVLRRLRRPAAGEVEEDGTWVDPSPPGDRELIALELRAQQAEIDARLDARRHFLRMQTWILVGIGSLIMLTIVVLVVGLWVGAISSAFATEVARTALPVLLGASATIVGAFFGVGSVLNPGTGFEIRRRSRDQE